MAPIESPKPHSSRPIIRRVVEELLAFSAFFALAVWATWPLLAQLGSLVAFPEDPFLNTWILDWHWWALTHGVSLFDANIFFPLRDTLAFSEHLTGIAAVMHPFRAFGLGALATHNVALLLGFAMAGYGAYVLGRTVSGSRLAAAAGGVFFLLLPYRFTQLTHLQTIWSGTLPLLLASAIHFARWPTWRRAAVVGALFAWNGLVNVHWLLLGSVALGLTIPLLALVTPRAQKEFWVPLCSALAVAGVLLIPFLLPYQRVASNYGLVRTAEETRAYSAVWSDWIRPNPALKWYGAAFDPEVNPERWLFPGVGVLLLALASFVPLRRDDGESPFRKSTSVWLLMLWVVLGLIGALGLNAAFHRFLFDEIFVFRAIRVPARWSMIVYTGLAGLAACGARVAIRRFGVAAGIVICLGLAIELEVRPVRWYRLPSNVPNVYAWLSDAPFTGGVLEVPLRQRASEYWYVLRATEHHRSIMNGTSGFVPPVYRDLVEAYHTTPIAPDFMDRLENLGCAIVIIHRHELAERSTEVRRWIREAFEAGRIQFLGVFDGTDFAFAVAKNVAHWRELRQPEVPDPSGRTPFESAAAFVLDDAPVYRPATFGHLDMPTPGGVVVGRLRVAGWVIAPKGVASVTLDFGNGRFRVPTQFENRPDVAAHYPWYESEAVTGFVHEFPERPADLDATDLQIEVEDQSGRITRLPEISFIWQ